MDGIDPDSSDPMTRTPPSARSVDSGQWQVLTAATAPAHGVPA